MKKIHLVSFNVPFPADYGGVISVFYHLKALAELKVKVILHCYQYGRDEAKELEMYAEEVHYYKRSMSISRMLSNLPFIVNTRRNELLLNRLLEDDYPIIFEGTHVSYFLSDKRLQHRKKIVRMHNVEWQYYKNMSLFEKDAKRKMYFNWEAKKLKQFELDVVAKYADAILAISPKDETYFKENGFSNVHYIPAFHPNYTVESREGRGDYILFQGDLSVSENEQVAQELIEKIFATNPTLQLVIAGRKPSKELSELVEKYDNVSLRQNVSSKEMEDLLQNAHIHLLRAFQPSGMKLKLLNALFQGRYVVVNGNMVKNTGLEELCIQIESFENISTQLQFIMERDFSSLHINQRRKALEHRFSNIENAKITMSLI